MTSSHNYGVNTLSLKGGNHDATRNYLEVLIYLAVLGMLVLSLQLRQVAFDQISSFLLR